MFKPNYIITPELALDLMKIEALKKEVDLLPITPLLLKGLRESARLASTHYSTMIEGNRLTQEQVEEVIIDHKKIPNRERDEKEVLGYYAALDWLAQQVVKGEMVCQDEIKMLHAIVMSGGNKQVKPTDYRDGQNVIRDGASGAIVYLPPEAHDVPRLMQELVSWLHASREKSIPCPIRAAIAHYQIATIHPYFDGNGRTARLLATLVLHLGGYGLKGIYSLDEYYAQNLGAYYEALTIGAHNYYLGRADADISSWVTYFCKGMVQSFEKVKAQALKVEGKGAADQAKALRSLDARQRKVTTLFIDSEKISSNDVALLFGLKLRSARLLMKKWVESGFLEVADEAKKTRSYRLGQKYQHVFGNG